MNKLRRAVIVVAIVCMALAVYQQWQAIGQIEWHFRADLLMLSFIGLLLLFFLDAYGWHLVLKTLGQSVQPGRSIRVWLISSLARYIPGGIWSYASRVALARDEGITLAAANMSLYLETLLLMASSLAIGLPALLTANRIGISLSAALMLWVVLGLLLHPGIIALLRFIPGKAGRAVSEMPLPSLAHMVGLYVYYLVFWGLFALVFALFANAFYPVGATHLMPVGTSIALGFFLGFVLVFVPGGIGVRETGIYLLLLPFLPAPVCLVISVGSRFWTMTGEVMAISLLPLLKWIPEKG